MPLGLVEEWPGTSEGAGGDPPGAGRGGGDPQRPGPACQAHWGYDETFLAAYRDELTVTPGDIAAHTIRVATLVGSVCGFYQLRGAGERAKLTDLWVEPAAIGQGHGRALWEHAVATARERGFRELLVQSDTHAEGFYRAMGAERIGVQPSTVIPGLELPLLRFLLA